MLMWVLLRMLECGVYIENSNPSAAKYPTQRLQPSLFPDMSDHWSGGGTASKAAFNCNATHKTSSLMEACQSCRCKCKNGTWMFLKANSNVKKTWKTYRFYHRTVLRWSLRILQPHSERHVSGMCTQVPLHVYCLGAYQCVCARGCAAIQCHKVANWFCMIQFWNAVQHNIACAAGRSSCRHCCLKFRHSRSQNTSSSGNACWCSATHHCDHKHCTWTQKKDGEIPRRSVNLDGSYKASVRILLVSLFLAHASE